MTPEIPVQTLGWRSAAEILGASESALYEGSPRVLLGRFIATALTLGVAQSLDSGIRDLARRKEIEIVIRGSGGLGVLHERGDLAWSLVLPRTDPRVGKNYIRNYAELGNGVVEGFRRFDIRGEWRPSGGRDPEICLLAERGEVLWIDGRVAGGAAQHLSGNALLHHGCIAVGSPGESTARLFGRDPKELRRKLVGLDELGEPPDPDLLLTAIGEEMSKSSGA